MASSTENKLPFDLNNIDFTSPIFITSVLVIVITIMIFIFAKLLKKSNSQNVEPDRAALVKIYKNAGGDSWDKKYSENWLKEDAPISTWAGIEGGFSNGSEHVLEFIMRGNKHFTGNFPQLFSLNNLVTIDLEHCKLSGPIPKEIGNLIHLTYLNLSFNNLTGGIPDELCNLQFLTFLNLNHNPLGGKIPSKICFLKKLEYLWLANCELEGDIPLEIGHLIELRDLILCENKLTGKLPNEIGVMSKLDRLIVSMNCLSGKIPHAIGQCKLLTLLYVDRNDFSGQLPIEITELANLQELWIYRTQVTVDGEKIEKMGKFLADRLPGVDIVTEQPLNASKVLVRKDHYGKEHN